MSYQVIIVANVYQAISLVNPAKKPSKKTLLDATRIRPDSILQCSLG